MGPKAELDALRELCRAVPAGWGRTMLCECCDDAEMAWGQGVVKGNRQALLNYRSACLRVPVRLASLDRTAFTPIVSSLFAEVIDWVGRHTGTPGTAEW